jgi:hypothetical protein
VSGNAGVCPNATIITAVFSKAMNPATINTSTFTLTTKSGASIAGAVSYVDATNTATFVPSATLAPNSTFTATVTTGVVDTFGNPQEDPFVWTFTTPVSCGLLPTVTLVTPPNGSVEVCPNTAIISATFSKAMNPTTINTTTFTLTGPGEASVAGTVNYVVASNVATFTPTPSASLAADTAFTATITTGAADTSGDPLAANFAWTFTTSAVCAPPTPILLGSACNYGILAGSTVTNTGPTIITGANLGLSPGNAVTGFPPGVLAGGFAIQIPPNTAPAQGQVDLTAAFNTTAGVQGGAVLPGNLSGLTFPPGVYKTSSTVQLTDASPSGAFTLDGQGNANAVFIFQIGSSLTTLPGTGMILAGGAQAKNIFWEVGSSATLGTTSVFQGNIMAQASVTLNTGATLNGRALARTGAVTLDSDAVNVPAPPCQ